MKRRLFPDGCVARRCHRHSYVASSRLAIRKNPSISLCLAISGSRHCCQFSPTPGAAGTTPANCIQAMVPTKRLELLRISALPPQDSVSTNSTTTAYSSVILLRNYFGICCGAGFCASAPAGAPTGAGAGAGIAPAAPSLTGTDCITPPPITPLADLGA